MIPQEPAKGVLSPELAAKEWAVTWLMGAPGALELCDKQITSP